MNLPNILPFRKRVHHVHGMCRVCTRLTGAKTCQACTLTNACTCLSNSNENQQYSGTNGNASNRSEQKPGENPTPLCLRLIGKPCRTAIKKPFSSCNAKPVMINSDFLGVLTDVINTVSLGKPRESKIWARVTLRVKTPEAWPAEHRKGPGSAVVGRFPVDLIYFPTEVYNEIGINSKKVLDKPIKV
jgi:hypothetical protein